MLYLIGLVALGAVLMGATPLWSEAMDSRSGRIFSGVRTCQLIIIIVLARFFTEVRTDSSPLADLLKAGCSDRIPLVLILKQPDLGTAMVLVPVAVWGRFLPGCNGNMQRCYCLWGF